MTELFKDSPAYGWMTESAREQAREEERQHALVQFQETVIALITRDFPRLAKLAKKQVSQVEDTGRLQQLILQVTLTRDASQIATLLADLDEDEQTAQPPLATEEHH